MSRKRHETKVRSALSRAIKHLNVLQFQYGDRNRNIVSDIEQVNSKFNKLRQVKKSKESDEDTTS